MLRVVLSSFVALVLVSAFDVQVPLGSSSRNDYPGGRGGDSDHTTWSLDKPPNPNSTDHFLFDTVYSLLQHWPNARMRKGHNIVPGIIPKGTLLFHGTIREEVPPGPEWVATDPEQAYACCWDIWSIIQSKKGMECWYLTLATTRPLNIIYFDGSSAAKFPDGSMDAENLMAWGESRPEDVLDESRRIRELCKWVQKFSVDGIVRMGINFEVMLCDFASGVSQVSFLNLVPPIGAAPPWGLAMFEVVTAHSRHNRFPGETRIQLDLARLVSFYDTQLVPSLVPIRVGQERWDHRLQNISGEDLSVVKSKVEGAMTSPWGSLSGIDWRTLVQVVIDLFAQRLELIRHLLNLPAESPGELIDLANKTQTQLRIMLTPYILLSARPGDPSDETDSDWSIPIYKLCATTHTYSMDSGPLTDSERLILQAVRGTTREICRVVTKMWTAGIYAGIDSSLNTKGSLDVAKIAQVRGNWAAELERLMGWLDWSVWVKCDPECGPEELCYMPTWPLGFPGFPPTPPTNESLSNTARGEELVSSDSLRTMGMDKLARPEENEWIRPRPRCMRRVEPYDF